MVGDITFLVTFLQSLFTLVNWDRLFFGCLVVHIFPAKEFKIAQYLLLNFLCPREWKVFP